MSSEHTPIGDATGVRYDQIDPFKIRAQKLARSTALQLNRFNFREVTESRGEPAFVWEEEDSFRAETIEGLGTKSLVAQEMLEQTGMSFYREIAQDTVAMITNDLITVGAKPLVLQAYVAAGNSEWFQSDQAREVLEGWHEACRKIGVTWGGGESPALHGLIRDGAVDLAGSAHGIIKPKENLVTGRQLEPGDQIVLIGSNGIHANGLTTARGVGNDLPRKLATFLPKSEITYGEALLKPTHLYSKLVENVLANMKPKRIENITGHGWRKLIRYNQNLACMIDELPDVAEEFKFIQRQTGYTDEEMYGAFNMGAGFAFFVSKDDVNTVVGTSKQLGFEAIPAGHLEEGPKRLEIRPLGITFPGSSLSIR